jgi:hypothetical protein
MDPTSLSTQELAVPRGLIYSVLNELRRWQCPARVLRTRALVVCKRFLLDLMKRDGPEWNSQAKQEYPIKYLHPPIVLLGALWDFKRQAS